MSFSSLNLQQALKERGVRELASSSVGQSAVKGASVGASVGSVVPGVGTAVGGIVGGALGAAESFFSGDTTLKEKDVRAIEQSGKPFVDKARQIIANAEKVNKSLTPGFSIRQFKDEAVANLQGALARYTRDLAELYTAVRKGGNVFEKTTKKTAALKKFAKSSNDLIAALNQVIEVRSNSLSNTRNSERVALVASGQSDTGNSLQTAGFVSGGDESPFPGTGNLSQTQLFLLLGAVGVGWFFIFRVGTKR